MIFEKN